MRVGAASAGAQRAEPRAAETRVGLEGPARTAATVVALAVPPVAGLLFFGLYGLAAGAVFSTVVYALDRASSVVPPGTSPPRRTPVVPLPAPPAVVPDVGPIDVTPVLPSSTPYVEPASSDDYSASCHAHYPPLTPTGWRVVCVLSEVEHPTSLAYGQLLYTNVQRGVRSWEDVTDLAEVLVEAVGPGVANLGDRPGTTAYLLRVVKVTHDNLSPGVTPIAPGELLVNVPPSFLRLTSEWDLST